MITVSPPPLHQDDWQRQLAQALTDPAQLLDALQLPSSLLAEAGLAARCFPFRATWHYVSLIEPGNPDDPLLRQILPLGEELHSAPGFVRDPVDDASASLGAGMLQKYRGRVLLITTGACAIHCRYCFRRNFPYSEDNALRHADQVLARLAEMDDVDEVILSGGDPLSLSDARLQALLSDLADIRHLKRLRLHTRLPVVLPERITARLTNMLAESRLDASMVLHCNHPRELSGALFERLVPLRSAGVPLLNQSVLLAGVNANLEILAELSEKLFHFGILPYYLHMLDPVEGTSHLAVPDEVAQRLVSGLRERLSGYLVPKLVREIPGAASKTPV